MKRREIGIVTRKMPQLPVSMTVGVLGGVVLMVVVALAVSGWNRHSKCFDQMVEDPSFDSRTVEQKAAVFDQCMDGK